MLCLLWSPFSENGQCCLTGSQSKKNLLNAVRDISIKSGAIKWDSLVVITNHGVGYTVTESPEPKSQIVTSYDNTDSTGLVSVCCREKTCFALTGLSLFVNILNENNPY